MTSGLLCRRLCIVLILASTLLFLPLTFSANNNDALATSIEEDYLYDLDRHNYELFLDAYQKCLKSTQEWNEAMAGSSWLDPSEHCGPPPQPPTPTQPLDCNELQTCSTSAPNRPPQDLRRLECGYEPYNCPLKTMCDGRRCEVIDCGLGTCPICPPGLGNLIIKAWCSYKCYPTGGAIIIIPVLGRYLPSLPLCI